jgi:hypothetical protein
MSSERFSQATLQDTTTFKNKLPEITAAWVRGLCLGEGIGRVYRRIEIWKTRMVCFSFFSISLNY